MHYPENHRSNVTRLFVRLSLLLVCWIFVSLPDIASASQRLVDDLGRTIVLPHVARRIIALDPTTVEVLYAVGAGNRLVGVGSYTNYPAAATILPKLDGLVPSREMLASLHPDLITLCDQQMTIEAANQKARLWGVPVYVSNSRTYVQVEGKIAKMGAYFGNPVATRRTVLKMRKALDLVRRKVAGRPTPSVFSVVWPKPLMTAGAGSFIADLTQIAGGRDVAANAKPYSEYPVEKLITDNPDLIVTDDTSLVQTRQALAGLHLRAVTTGHVYSYPPDIIVRAGPRLADGLVALAKIIHPELFGAK